LNTISINVKRKLETSNIITVASGWLLMEEFGCCEIDNVDIFGDGK